MGFAFWVTVVSGLPSLLFAYPCCVLHLLTSCMHDSLCCTRHRLQCRDAKLSVLDWDDNAHTIHTSSLHYFDGDPSLRMGRTVFPLGPKAVTDPQVLCPTSAFDGCVCMSCIDHSHVLPLPQACHAGLSRKCAGLLVASVWLLGLQHHRHACQASLPAWQSETTERLCWYIASTSAVERDTRMALPCLRKHSLHSQQLLSSGRMLKTRQR